MHTCKCTRHDVGRCSNRKLYGAVTAFRCHGADLGPGGEIIFEGAQFKSPSAFSVHVKRKQNPGRKADDGWYVSTAIFVS